MDLLKDVGLAALEDHGFFEALLDNPQGALREKGLTLSPDDLQVLEAAIQRHKAVQPHMLGSAPGEDPLMLVKLVHLQHWQAWGTQPEWPNPVIDKLPEFESTE